MSKRKKLLVILLFALGIGIAVYPTVSNWINQQHGSYAIQELEQNLKDTDIDRQRAQAEDYNARLRNSEEILEEEYTSILNIANGSNEETTDLLAELVTPTKKVPEKGTAEYEAAKARVKEGKAKTREIAQRDAQNDAAHVTLSFSNYENFVAFCDLMGVAPDVKFVKGEELLQMFE